MRLAVHKGNNDKLAIVYWFNDSLYAGDYLRNDYSGLSGATVSLINRCKDEDEGYFYDPLPYEEYHLPGEFIT